jgi:hypothetical protein
LAPAPRFLDALQPARDQRLIPAAQNGAGLIGNLLAGTVVLVAQDRLFA